MIMPAHGLFQSANFWMRPDEDSHVQVGGKDRQESTYFDTIQSQSMKSMETTA